MAAAAPETDIPVEGEGAVGPPPAAGQEAEAGGSATQAAAGEAGAAAGSLEAAERKKELGNAAFKAKKHAEAVQLYGEAIAEAGAAAPGVYFSNRAVCQAALGDWAAAREDAAEALRRPGGVTKKAIFQKVRAEVRLQRLAEAQETLAFASEHGLRQDVLKLLSDEGLPAGLAQPEAAQRTAAPVAPAAKPASEQAEAPPPAAKPAAEFDAAAKAKEAGTAKYKEGAYREALAEYRRALDLLPQDDAERRAPLLGNVAAACLMLRRADECREACEQSLALDPGNSKVRARLATAKAATGDFVAARAALGEINGDATLANARKQVDEWEGLFSSADSTFSGGEPAKALGMYSDLETKALFHCPALALKMGRCYLELKNYPRALNATQQVLRANPRNIDALVLRTEALYRNNTASVESKQWTDPLDQGQKLLKEALAFDPDHSGAQVLRKRLRLLCTKHAEMREAFDGREFEKAQEVLDDMIEQGHDNPRMLGNLYVERARAGVRLKDWRQVLKDVGQATYRNHELVQPYLFRAQALQALDRHEDAVKELEQLLSWHREQSVYDKLQDAKFLLRKKKRANYYELLGVPSIASQLEIKKAYRERAAEWHPDKKGHLGEEAKKNAEEMFKRIGEAYEVLTDPQKKELYDKGYDREGIDEQMELKKRRTEGCGMGGCRPGGCGGGG
mmetsp:Transcript_36483/g.105090  ORF Transcript_36483/g.105090 Transcript_36483/m.105090 type:complete len:681 (-) Transcript_36483:2153-4195(-)